MPEVTLLIIGTGIKPTVMMWIKCPTLILTEMSTHYWTVWFLGFVVKITIAVIMEIIECTIDQQCQIIWICQFGYCPLTYCQRSSNGYEGELNMTRSVMSTGATSRVSINGYLSGKHLQFWSIEWIADCHILCNINTCHLPTSRGLDLNVKMYVLQLCMLIILNSLQCIRKWLGTKLRRDYFTSHGLHKTKIKRVGDD